eukprot:7797580-Karenia_brevis.AAC.1
MAPTSKTNILEAAQPIANKELVSPTHGVRQGSESGEAGRPEEIGQHEEDDEDIQGQEDEEDEMQIEDGEIISPEVPEVRAPKTLPDPGNPTQSEIEDHYLANHLPYRSWCECCVRGKAKDLPHRKSQPGGPAEVPLIGMDFQHPGTDSSEEARLNILTVKDTKSKAVFCYPCSSKAPSEAVADKVINDIEVLGYGRIALRCDNEPAIRKLQKIIVNRRKQDTIPQNSPAYSSKSNGAAERAVQSVTGHIR